jgi:hypothetical protein
MTTEQGSSRSQAEVHERTQAEVFASDDKYILDFLNYEFYDFHSMFGLPQEGRWSFKEDSSVKEMKEIEKDMKLKLLGYTFTPEQIAEKYGLEKPQVQPEEEEVEEKPAPKRRLKKAAFNPNAKDGDGDGLVQDGTIWERKAPKKK